MLGRLGVGCVGWRLEAGIDAACRRRPKVGLASLAGTAGRAWRISVASLNIGRSLFYRLLNTCLREGLSGFMKKVGRPNGRDPRFLKASF
ncbi:MAG: hypothetical protein QXS76_02050 [Candidatus Bathyarchaeia archaeon]